MRFARGACAAIAFDISNFFPSIDHHVLLDNLRTVLGLTRLPGDWFAVYKSMTHFAWVEAEEIANILGCKVNDIPRPIAEVETFREWRRSRPGFVKTNNEPHGIPQGSPISAALSNVYMIGFDAEMHAFAKSIGASYRRYSDDILVVCAAEEVDDVRAAAQGALKKLGTSIEINDEKTEISRFSPSSNGLEVDSPLSTSASRSTENAHC